MTPIESLNDAKAKAKVTADKCDGLRNQIMESVNRISTQVPTSLRSVLERYYPHMRMSMAYNGASQFPQTMRPQLRKPERTTVDRKADVLCFHVGNAILAFYAQDADLLKLRVQVLEDIAVYGYSKCRVEGTVQKGYVLGLPLVAGKKKPNVPVPTKKTV